MRILLGIVFLLLGSWLANAEPMLEVGAKLGVNNYLGDLSYAFGKNTNVSGGLLVRYQLTNRFNLRADFDIHKLKGSGVINNKTESFSKDVLQGALLLEVNFLKFIAGNLKTPFSPYFNGGPALVNYKYNPSQGASSNVNTLALRLGVGIKANPWHNWTTGVEYGFTKLFDDKLDNQKDPLLLKATDGQHNNDWIFLGAIYLNYAINLQRDKCYSYLD